MFDISFIELFFFALVGLLVLDADDIPKMARVARSWLNKLAELKYEITGTLDEGTKELNLKELLKVVEDEKKQVETELREIEKTLPQKTSSGEIIKHNQERLKRAEEEKQRESENV